MSADPGDNGSKSKGSCSDGEGGAQDQHHSGCVKPGGDGDCVWRWCMVILMVYGDGDGGRIVNT